jgi:Gpi18-like mannosyltransferase
VFAGAGVFALDSARLEYLIKATNVLFGLGDAVLVYRILRKLQVGERWSLAGSALFLFNPAVWYSMSVWGQTHVISLFFVLAVIWFAETNRPLLAWLALAAACLTRPQMLVFGLLLGVVLLKKFRWERSVVALSWTAVLTFLVLLPLTLATSPSLPVDIMLNNFQIQEAGGNDPGLTPVSQGAYSIWPLVTYVSKGASGLQREFVPSSRRLTTS